MSGPERGDIPPLRWATYGDMTDAEIAETKREEAIAAADEAKWYGDYANIVELVAYMADTYVDAKVIAHCVEKPWNYTAEWIECVEARDDE